MGRASRQRPARSASASGSSALAANRSWRRGRSRRAHQPGLVSSSPDSCTSCAESTEMRVPERSAPRPGSSPCTLTSTVRLPDSVAEAALARRPLNATRASPASRSGGPSRWAEKVPLPSSIRPRTPRASAIALASSIRPPRTSICTRRGDDRFARSRGTPSIAEASDSTRAPADAIPRKSMRARASKGGGPAGRSSTAERPSAFAATRPRRSATRESSAENELGGSSWPACTWIAQRTGPVPPESRSPGKRCWNASSPSKCPLPSTSASAERRNVSRLVALGSKGPSFTRSGASWRSLSTRAPSSAKTSPFPSMTAGSIRTCRIGFK